MNTTCKDCIHYPVCADLNPGMVDVFGEDSTLEPDGLCKHFEDKSRFIELPCAVGDTVFYIDTCRTAEDYGKKFINSSRVKRISIDNEFAILHDHSVILFENLFLTKEDAEAELKKKGGAE